MELSITILLSLIALICFAGGANLLIKGAGSFLPEDLPSFPILDDLFRFLAGIYFGMNFLLLWVILHISEVGQMVYFLGIIVIFSGLGRLYSRIKVGSAGRYFDVMMVEEIILGIALMVLQYFR